MTGAACVGHQAGSARGTWEVDAGVEVVFLTDRAWTFGAPWRAEGTFVEATQALFAALNHLRHPPAGSFAAPGCMLIVQHVDRAGAAADSGAALINHSFLAMPFSALATPFSALAMPENDVAMVAAAPRAGKLCLISAAPDAGFHAESPGKWRFCALSRHQSGTAVLL